MAEVKSNIFKPSDKMLEALRLGKEPFGYNSIRCSDFKWKTEKDYVQYNKMYKHK